MPYIEVFLAFVVCPVCSGIWMGSKPSLYAELFADPIYAKTVVNTALFLGVAINLKMFCALLLSGFFMRRGPWVNAPVKIFVLPRATPAPPALMFIHWLLHSGSSTLNNLLYPLFGIPEPGMLSSRPHP